MCGIICFNTSHVVVYPGVAVVPAEIISFNTSHVVVYLKLLNSIKSLNLCFNTSHVVVYHYARCCCTGTSEFQYISCCSLSQFLCGGMWGKNSFNTSHVVVYQTREMSGFCRHRGFNTSHVVVYPFPPFARLHLMLVSIHLML